ncbi:hypothetical protein Q5752_006781 [Cryptotrichosporon argae]
MVEPIQQPLATAPIVGVTPATPPISPSHDAPQTAPATVTGFRTAAPASIADTVKADVHVVAQQVKADVDAVTEQAKAAIDRLPAVPASVATDPSLHWLGLCFALCALAYARIPPFWLLVGAFVGYLAITQHVAPRHERVVQQAAGGSKGDGDAVSWVNHMLYALFPLISTDVLTPFIDLLEDALMEQVPPVVTSTRIVSPALGSQPVLLTSMRPLSDEEWFAAIAKAPPAASSADKNGKLRRLFKHNATEAAYVDTSRQRSASTSTRASLPRSPSASSVPTTSSRPAETPATARRRRDLILSKLTGRRGQVGAVDTGGQAQAGQGKLSEERTEQRAARDRDEMRNSGLGEDESDGAVGQYVNYQVGFEYERTAETQRKGYGLHMLGYFGWGIKGLGGSEIPIYLDVISIKGTLNLRLLLSASPPFIRQGTFSFQSLPEFEISAKPLKNVGFGSFNAMDIGPLRSYVQASIAQVAQAFVAPQSYSLDIDRLLLGREASLRTAAVGVLHIIVHGARDVLKADTMGTADPYIAISFSKFNKPLFSTRTICDTQNPVWEEPAFILVSGDAIVAGEKVCLRLYDSDRLSADDSLGMISVELAELIDSANASALLRHDKFEADQPGMRTSGDLDWSVRFCPLWSMSEDEMRRKIEDVRKQNRAGPTKDETAGPWWMRRMMEEYVLKPAWAIEREHQRKETIAWFAGEKERDEMEVMAKPKEEFKSGVLQFHIHQCADLELESLSGTYSAQTSRHKSAALGKPALADVTDRTPAENPDPPSAYVEVHLNDKLVYRTRTKQVTPNPFYNAVSERFVVDWTRAKIVFVVRDERDREHDPILGIVNLRLKDLFEDGCQFTRWFPVVGGLGWGQLRLSLLFKPVDVQLPPSLSGYDAATLAINSFSTTDLSREYGKRLGVMVETEYDRFILTPPRDDAAESRESQSHMSLPETPSSVAARSTSSRHAPTGSSASVGDDLEAQYVLPRPIRLAVQYRHSCSAIITFFTRSGVMRKRKAVAIAILPLSDFGTDGNSSEGGPKSDGGAGAGGGVGTTGNTDGSACAAERVVPIFRTSSVPAAVRASQAFRAHQTGGGSVVLRPDEGTTLAGFASVGFELHEGVSRAHCKIARRDLRFAKVVEAWEVGRMLRVADGGVNRDEAPDDEQDGDGEGDGDGYGGDGGDDDDDDDESDDDDELDATAAGRHARRKSGESMASKKTIEQEDDEAFKKEKWAHSKALHRKNRGIFQLKIARTGRFVADKLAAKYHATAGAGSHKLDGRARGGDVEVEHEGQSHM